MFWVLGFSYVCFTCLLASLVLDTPYCFLLRFYDRDWHVEISNLSDKLGGWRLSGIQCLQRHGVLGLRKKVIQLNLVGVVRKGIQTIDKSPLGTERMAILAA